MGEPSEEKGNTETIETEKQSAYRYMGSSVKNDTRVFELQIEQGMEPTNWRLCREVNCPV